MLSYYVQLREHMRSSINCSATPEPEAYSQQERRHLVDGVRPPKHLTESTVPNTMAQKDLMSAEPVDLDDAFEAMTQEIKFDWPEFSPVDRIKAGLIQSALGLLLFLALMVAFGFLQRGLVNQL
jgi:hypothetical protein